MKLNDIRIRTQLHIGLGIILLAIAFVGLAAWLQTDKLWNEAQGLYQHPHQVRRALGAFQADILTIKLEMNSLIAAENFRERLAVMQQIEATEADALQHFEIVQKLYTGPRADINQIIRTFHQWKAERNEVIELIRTGRTSDAAALLNPLKNSQEKLSEVLENLKQLSDHTASKAYSFYRNAEAEREYLKVWLLGIIAASLILTALIAYLLLNNIKTPLNEIFTVVERYRKGALDSRCKYCSTNEFGALAASFNQLADFIENELSIRKQIALLSAAMLSEEDPRKFSQSLLATLMEMTDSQLGAVYLLNAAGTDFEHFESIGMDKPSSSSFSAALREGEFGRSVTTRRMQHITEIPEDTAFIFTTVGGFFKPKEILTVPIINGSTVCAIISLSSVKCYESADIRLLEDTFDSITARFIGILANQRIRLLSEMLTNQNRELEEQQKELLVQADELSEQNIELELQKTQLDEANRLKSVFLSNMSHELRTPLNSIIALIGVLSRRLRTIIPKDEFSYLEIIERNGRNLLTLINDILDLSRIEAGRTELSFTNFSLEVLATEVTTLISPQAVEKNIKLLNHVRPNLPLIRSDFDKCRHILQNIIANAVKFTDKGSVEISAEFHDDTFRVSVSDTGIGIETDMLDTIFDEFLQLDDSSSRRFEGTGLGLSIAKKYATMLGGNIEVVSTPGKGSRFTLVLPVRPDFAPIEYSVPIEPVLPTVHTAVPTGQVCSIMLVEDSEPAIVQITDILDERGYRVLAVHNGSEALQLLESMTPDAMILDLMMPGLDGFQVLEQIRAQEKTAQLPVLILTAKHVTASELRTLKGNNIQQLIQKGDICKSELLAAVEKMTSFAHPAQKIERKPAGKPVVLIVEDNPDNMKTVRALLQDDYMLLEATDGSSAVLIAKSQVPDLILMDISLPITDGFASLAKIREDDSLRHIPVIALTARAMVGDREDILERGFDGYVSKPIDPLLLEKSIQEALNEHQSP